MPKKPIIISLIVIIVLIGAALFFLKKGSSKVFSSINDAANSNLKLSCVDNHAADIPIFIEGKKYKYTITDNNEPFTQIFDGDSLYSFNPNEKQGLELSKDCLGKTNNEETKQIIEEKLMPFDPGIFNCKEVNSIDFSLPAGANWIDGCQIMLKRDSNPTK